MIPENTIILVGASGKLGSAIRKLLSDKPLRLLPIDRAEQKEVVAAIEQQHSSFLVLDVSLPAGTMAWIGALTAVSSQQQSLCRGFLTGVTGHSTLQLQALKESSKMIPVCMVSNFSAGIFLFEQLLSATTQTGMSVSQLATHLGFDLALWEAHHTQKLDAPSGTARTIAERAGIPAEKIASTRVGSVIGEHTLFLAKEAEELRITHMAHTRELFANGAVFLAEKMLRANLSPGFYTKEQVFLS